MLLQFSFSVKINSNIRSMTSKALVTHPEYISPVSQDAAVPLTSPFHACCSAFSSLEWVISQLLPLCHLHCKAYRQHPRGCQLLPLSFLQFTPSYLQIYFQLLLLYFCEWWVYYMSGEGGFKFIYILKKNTKLEKKRRPARETNTNTVTFWKRDWEPMRKTMRLRAKILVLGEDDTSLVFSSFLCSFSFSSL